MYDAEPAGLWNFKAPNRLATANLWQLAEQAGSTDRLLKLSRHKDLMITEYHAKFFAHEITRMAPAGSGDQLSMALFDAAVDLNPHQIEAAMFAL